MIFLHRLSEEPGLTVHFNVHMDPSVRTFEGSPGVTSQAITDVLTREIAAASNETTSGNSVLGDLIIDLDSLEVHGQFLA